MKPQADFNKWADNFKSELENEKKFSAFYPDCIELIDQYIKNGSLSPPIDKKSDKFVRESIPTFIKLILKFKSLSKEIIDATINFLAKVLSLLTFRVIKDNLSEGKLILDILDSELNLYNRPNVKQFQRLCNLYINNGDYKKLLERTTADKPDFQHLLLVYRIRKLLKSYVDIPISEFLPVLYKFITHFKDDVSLRTVDTAKFTKIINNEILDNLDEEDKTNYTDLFNLASYLIKTEIFDKQLLGVEIFLTYKKKIGKENGTFEKWIQTSDLLSYLCKTDLHVEVIKRIQPIIKFCSKKHLITIKMIESLFERAAVTHKSEREPTYELIMSAFKGYDNNSIINFLQTHNPDDLFLSVFMEKSKELEIVRYCAITLIKRESKADLLARLNKNIRQIIIEYINQNFKTQNIKYLQEILPELIKTSKDPVKEFDEHVNIIIRDYAGTEDKQEFVLLIYKSYLIRAKSKTEIKIGITKQLFQCPNDNLWTFFSDLFKEIESSLFDTASFQYIDQYLQNFDYSKVESEKFVNFMNAYSYKSMEFHRNESNKSKNRNSDSDSDYDIDENFDFLSFPQSFLPILMKAYFTIQSKEDSPVFIQVQNNLIYFFSQLEDSENEIMAKAISIAFFPYLDPGNQSNKKSSNLYMERSLSLLIKLINKSEDGIYLEDFGKQRHKEEIMFYPEITLDFENSKRIIHQDLEVPCSTLIKRIKAFTKNTQAYANYYKLKIYSCSAEVEKTRILSSLHDTNFIVKNYGKILKNKMVSIILHDKYQLTNKLLSLLNDESIDKKILDLAWELVQLLPSLKDIKVDLHSCKSEYLLRYSLDLISIDKSFNNYSLLAELLISRKLKHSDIFIMSVILRLFNDEFVQYFPQMCKIILDQFKIEKVSNKIIPAQLIQKLSKKYKDSDKILLKYTDGIVTMLFSVSKETIQPIIRTVDPINPLKSIFDKVIEKFDSIKELENKDWIIKGLFSLYQSHSDDIDIKKLIELTMKIADLIQCDTLIQLIHSILKSKPDEKDTMKKYVLNNLLNRIYKDDNLTEFESYINLKKYYDKDIDLSLEKLLMNPDTKCKAFNIKPPSKEDENEESNENDNAFRGMENMGVTCFMNSTLQQLFFTFPFRYLVLTTEKDTLLYNIFSELVATKKESVQMKKYIPEVDEIIDTHSQQDASEFYQLLIEKQNEDCQNIFKGKFINHCEGINNDYSSVNEEDFTCIALTVIGKKNLHESFESLCEPDIVQIGENKDANKYQRILKAPQALVIQLKRFEIDFTSFRRYKVNSIYEFPETFDIGPYMDDKKEKIYELFGVVIHSGRANSGHYYSLIKLNGKWYEFNDNYVHEFPEEKFQKYAFGSDKSERSGYLLFYHEKDAVFTDGKNKIRYDEVPDPSLANEILNDLNKEKLHYCLFTKSFLQLANESSSLQFQIYYFFNVFLHSVMDSDQCNEFITNLTNNLKLESGKGNKKEDPIKSFTKLAVDEIDSFTGMLIKCKSEDILNSSILLMESISDNKYSFDFYNALIQKLDRFIVDWDKLSYVSRILLKATKTTTLVHIKKAKINEWNIKIINFIQKFYKEASSKAKNNINFSDFFEILKLLDTKDVSILEDDFKNIILSPSNSSILTLLDSKQKEKVFTLFDNSNSYVSFILESVFPIKEENDDEIVNKNVDFMVDSIFEHPPTKMKKSDILKSLIKEIKNRKSTSLSDSLINNYQKLILPLFFDQSSDVRSKAESLTYQLFNKKANQSSAFSSSSSSSSSSDDENDYMPKQKILSAQETNKKLKEFCQNLPDYVNKANSIIDSDYIKDTSFIISFLRIVLWSSKQCEIFDLLVSIYQTVNKKNKNETNPDQNYVDTIMIISKHLKLQSKNYTIQHERELIPIIYDLFRFGSYESTSKQIFEIMSRFTIDSLIIVYKSKEFMNFFKKETKLKKSEESFNKYYNLNEMFENIVSTSEEVATNLVNFVQNESSLEVDHMTITLIIKCKIRLVSDQLYLDSINYIINCALENADFDLFKIMIDTINSTFQSRIKENFDFSKIEKRLIDSLTFLRGANAKSKRFYGEMITNICTKSEKITNLVLKNLLNILSNIANDDEKIYRYYILTFQNTIVKTGRFDYFDQFSEKVAPLAPIDFWLETDGKPYLVASENYDKLSDSKFILVKTVLIDHRIKQKEKALYSLIKKFIGNTPMDKLEVVIKEIKENTENYDDEQISNLKYNFGVLSKFRHEIKNVLIESSSSSSSNSSSD